MPQFGLGQTLFEMRYRRSMEEQARAEAARMQQEQALQQHSRTMAELGMRYGQQQQQTALQEDQQAHQMDLQGRREAQQEKLYGQLRPDLEGVKHGFKTEQIEQKGEFSLEQQAQRDFESGMRQKRWIAARDKWERNKNKLREKLALNVQMARTDDQKRQALRDHATNMARLASQIGADDSYAVESQLASRLDAMVADGRMSLGDAYSQLFGVGGGGPPSPQPTPNLGAQTDDDIAAELK